MIKFGKKVEESVGLDIGTYSIKVTSVKNESGEKVLTGYNIKKFPLDKKEVNVEQLIEETLEEIDLHPETVNLAISGPEVIVRFINLPVMSREQLQNALVFEAEKYIPFNVNEVVLDFLILGDAPETGQMRVLLAAAKRQPIESMVNTIKKLDIIVNVLDINAFAMFNAFTASNPPPEEKGAAFLDLGHSQTDVLIATGKQPSFMRQIQIGGKDVTDAICRALSIPADKAEECKLNPGEENKETVLRATASVLDDLAQEVHLSFGYFENRYNKPVSDIYCSGGMVYQEGIVEYLKEKLGVEVKKWNPVSNMKISEFLSREDIDSVASQLPISIGLALRG
ncbi:MAG: type IV pilus assembly protein PilM [Candidatus Omnitrophota bacterium]|nr:type IV pilus assembly protein PilM [Candidatus Omnitrophota bacterium]